MVQKATRAVDIADLDDADLSYFEGLTEEQLALLEQKDPDTYLKITRTVHELRLARMREDVNEFVPYVMKDRDGNKFKQANHHRELQRIFQHERNAIVWGAVGGGKTYQMIGYVLWAIGNNPDISICILQATQNKAIEIVATLKRYIEESAEFKEVFPNIEPGWVWTTLKFAVKSTSGVIQRDVTVQAAGINGDVTSKRFDLIIVDDAVTEENTRTPEYRSLVHNWIQSTLMSRLSHVGRIVMTGNAWHSDDSMHRFAAVENDQKQRVWFTIRLAHRDPITGEPTWPEVWSKERLEAWIAIRSPEEVGRSIDCIVIAAGGSRFNRDWFRDARYRGRGKYGPAGTFPFRLKPANGARIFHGVDLGHKKKPGADYTVFFTVLLLPNGHRYVINIVRERLNPAEIVERLLELHVRYGGEFFVESVGAQDYVLEFAPVIAKLRPELGVKPEELSVRPWGTIGHGNVITNKFHAQFGVASLAIAYRRGAYTWPADPHGKCMPVFDVFEGECMDFNPTKTTHTGDILMAAWICDAAIRVHGLGEQLGQFIADPLAEPELTAIEILPHHKPMPQNSGEDAKEKWRAARRAEDAEFRKKHNRDVFAQILSQFEGPAATTSNLEVFEQDEGPEIKNRDQFWHDGSGAELWDFDVQEKKPDA